MNVFNAKPSKNKEISMSRYEWGNTHPGIEALETAVHSARASVVTHPLYTSLDNRQAIVTFMEHHVFAVWDFMSLLKSLQRQLTCVAVPWVPSGPSESRRLINDIVLVEESDELDGSFTSHFELYVLGMAKAGADTSVISGFIEELKANRPIRSALANATVPAPSVDFVTSTWDIIDNAPLHCQAAAFAFGREDLIPDMFTQVAAVNSDDGRFETFLDYLERHIEVDGEQHTPMAMQMLADLCGDDTTKWQECVTTVNSALLARTKLWDGILGAIRVADAPTTADDLTVV
jgi:hypothetical protein